jgi:hypothetical protein
MCEACLKCFVHKGLGQKTNIQWLVWWCPVEKKALYGAPSPQKISSMLSLNHCIQRELRAYRLWAHAVYCYCYCIIQFCRTIPLLSKLLIYTCYCQM